MKQKELIDYQVIEVASLKEDDFVNGFSIDKDNEALAIEFRGKGDLFFLGKVFLYLKNKTQEIIYRSERNSDAYIVFSLLDKERYFHGSDIIEEITWQEEELKTFLEKQESDKSQEETIDLSLLENLSQDREEEYLQEFLRKIYSFSPKKEKLFLKGSCHPYIYLLILDWFSNDTKKIYLQEKRLS